MPTKRMTISAAGPNAAGAPSRPASPAAVLIAASAWDDIAGWRSAPWHRSTASAVSPSAMNDARTSIWPSPHLDARSSASTNADGFVRRSKGTVRILFLRVHAIIRRHTNPQTIMEKPAPATGPVKGMFPIQSCNPTLKPHIYFIDFGRTIGPFRLWLCQAHVQTLSPNIDEPEHRAAFLRDLQAHMHSRKA